MDEDSVYVILDMIFGASKVKRYMHFLSILKEWDENFRSKKRIAVYKFLYIALFDFCTYSNNSSKNLDYKATNMLYKQMYLPMKNSKVDKCLNPKFYQWGVSNIIPKHKNYLNKCSPKKKEKKSFVALNPERDFFEDFETIVAEEKEEWNALY